MHSLLRHLREEAGELETIFAGFDFPIGVPVHFAERAGITKFRDFLPQLALHGADRSRVVINLLWTYPATRKIGRRD
jgi:hypothetical protein